MESAPIRTDLRLLTRVSYHDAGGESRECFASILELGPNRARIESARPLETGCALRLQVVFPGQRQYASRHVQLRFVISGAHDELNLHYNLQAADMDQETRERLALYLSRDPEPES